MIIAKSCYNDMLNSLVRTIYGRVELYEGSTLLHTFTRDKNLKSFTVERAGDSSKFFGYGICQKLKVEILDSNRKLNLLKGQRLEVAVGVGCDYIYPFPVFFIEEIKRDENTNTLTVTAYDALNEASKHTVAELNVFKGPYTIETFIASCAGLLGMPIKRENLKDECFCYDYVDGAGFEGKETLREALNAAAEATQTIYYINNNWELVFRRLDVTGEPVTTIDKSKYFTLTSESNVTLNSVVFVDDFDIALEAKDANIEGLPQYVRSNPFWGGRKDIDEVMNKALAAVAGLSINQFNCSWRGNFLIEIGDRIGLTTRDGQVVYSYLLNDAMTYDGGFKATTQWQYSESSSEKVNTTPTTIGETVKQTYAKVDRANKRIELVSSDMTSLILENNKISTSVAEMSSDVEGLTKKVEAAVTPNDVRIQVQEALANGYVTDITTTTGFTFNKDGLTVSKSDTEMATTITEDGMIVYRDAEAMLTADHNGVNAMNLHATTYLFIGAHSLLQDYDFRGNERTGCFWIEK